MLNLNARFRAATSQAVVRPRITIEMFFDEAETDAVYFTSDEPNPSLPVSRPSGVTAIDNCIEDFSGGTQKVTPKNNSSSIGSFSFSLVDLDGAVSALLAQKFDEGKSPRNKKVVFYFGSGLYQSATEIREPVSDNFENDQFYTEYETLDWIDYSKRFTMVLKEYQVSTGMISFTANDIQRLEVNNIFDIHKSTLRASVDSSQLRIPVALTLSSTLFPTFEHDAQYSDLPGEVVSYCKLENEVFSHRGLVDDPELGVSFDVVQRGALNTFATSHTVDESAEDSTKTSIEEFIYLEGPALKILYAIQTGILYDQGSSLPDHWHQGIAEQFVRVSDYINAGPLLWDSNQNTGRTVRFEGLTSVEGKQFIEKEILPWLVGFRPIYSDGAIGFKKLTSVLSGADYVAEIDDDNVVSFGSLKHNLNDVINDISVRWDYSFQSDSFLQTTRVIDTQSISKYSEAIAKELELKGVRSTNQTDQDLRNVFDAYRNRFSAGGITLTATVLPSVNYLEVGDVVRVRTNTIRDPLTGNFLDRVFEVQQIQPGAKFGNIGLNLFASAEAAGEFEVISASTVLEDDFYISQAIGLGGTDISSFPGYSNGELTQDITLDGGDTLGDGIYYHDGDLTIPFGVTVTINKNVQLRVKGVFSRIGNIVGAGNGYGGGSAGTAFAFNVSRGSGLIKRDDWRIRSNQTKGVSGYFGTTYTSNYAHGAAGYYSNTLPFLGYAFSDNDPTVGLNSSVDRLPLVNRDGLLLDGINALDLQGTSGGGSQAAVVSGDNTFIAGSGGAGGASGAGLMVIARGEVVGASSTLDLSGLDGSVGATVDTFLNENRMYSNGGGAGGLPGAYYLLIDGAATFGSSVNNIVQNRGLSGLGGDTTAFDGYLSGDEWNHQNMPSNQVANFGRRILPETDLGSAGFKVQYVPQQLGLSDGTTVVSEEYQFSPIFDIELFSGEDHLLLAKDGAIRERILVTWGEALEDNAIGYEVQATEYVENEPSDWRTVAVVTDLSSPQAYFDVDEGLSYIVRLRVFGGENTIPSDWVSTGIYQPEGKSSPPSAPEGFTVSARDDLGLVISVDEHPDVDFLEFRVFANDELIFSGNATRFVWEKVPAGTYEFSIVAVDRSRNESISVSEFFDVLGPGDPQASVAFQNQDVVIDFESETNTFQILHYRIESLGSTLAFTDATQFRKKVDWLGSQQFTITAIDLFGNESAAVDVVVNPIVPGTASISAEVIDNNVLLRYSASSNSLPIDYYELRQGADFDSPLVVEIKAGTSTFTSFFEESAGSYTYWVFAVDTAGNSGAAAGVTVELSQPPDFVLLDSFSESSDGFPGSLSNAFLMQSGRLLLPVNSIESWQNHFAANNYVNIQGQINDGMLLYAQPSSSSGYYERNYDLGAEVSATITVSPTFQSVVGSPVSQVQISTSPDNVSFVDAPQGTAKLFAANFRYLRVRVTVTSSGGDDLIELTELSVRIDSKSISDQGKGLASGSDASGTAVLFNVDFVDVDSIVVTPFATTPVIHVVDFDDLPNPSGFSVYLFDSSGVRVSGSFSWVARGK